MSFVEEVDREREKIVESLSSLSFREKQMDVFAKRHPGTGQWLLETEEFRQWLEGEGSSTL
jgi:predicted ATPase